MPRSSLLVPASCLLAISACAERSAPAVTNQQPVVAEPTPAAPEVDAAPPSDADAASQASVAVADAGADAAKRPAGPELTTTALASWIYDQPRPDAAHAGVLRVGTRVRRSAEPVKGIGCHGRWFSIEPGGFVCEGNEGITLDVEAPEARVAAAYPAKIDEPLPFGYGTSWGSPLYVRLPTNEEQKKLEGDWQGKAESLRKMRDKLSERKRWPDVGMPLTPTPEFLLGGKSLANLGGIAVGPAAVTAGNAWPTLRPAFLTAFEHEGRTFYLTTEHFLIPADRMRPAKLAEFRGVELTGEGGDKLPMVWVNWKPVPIYRLFEAPADGAKGPREGAIRVVPNLFMAVQAHATITGKVHTRGKVHYLELASPPEGAPEPSATYLVPDHMVSRVDAATELPPNVGKNDEWIEVAIGRQTLVLYEGLTPVFVTLVSSGVDGNGDPEKTKSTPRGVFRIHSKHVTTRMRGDEKPAAKDGDKPDPRYRVDDVPYAQFFHAGYALHGAYWHDAFGQPKSHGCINLSPRDALWLFQRTKPRVPAGWHAAYSARVGLDEGTWVYVKAY